MTCYFCKFKLPFLHDQIIPNVYLARSTANLVQIPLILVFFPECCTVALKGFVSWWLTCLLTAIDAADIKIQAMQHKSKHLNWALPLHYELTIPNLKQKWLTLWLVLCFCFSICTSSLLVTATSVVIISFNRTTTCFPIKGCSAERCCCSQSRFLTILPPGFFLVPAVSHQLSREWEGGAGKGSSLRVQGPLALSPHSSLSWQFPPSTWSVSSLNPCRSMWVFG